jgi:hypothetical protein
MAPAASLGTHKNFQNSNRRSHPKLRLCCARREGLSSIIYIDILIDVSNHRLLPFACRCPPILTALGGEAGNLNWFACNLPRHSQPRSLFRRCLVPIRIASF